MFQRSGGSEVSEFYVNHGGALRIVINVWWEVGRGQYPTHRSDWFHRHQEGSALLTGRTVDAPPSGKPEGILLKV